MESCVVTSTLASVPGTPQAQEALIANSIPQTASITRSEAELNVKYDGEAVFVPIQGTSMSYAQNCRCFVLRRGLTARNQTVRSRGGCSRLCNPIAIIIS